MSRYGTGSACGSIFVCVVLMYESQENKEVTLPLTIGEADEEKFGLGVGGGFLGVLGEKSVYRTQRGEYCKLPRSNIYVARHN
ncbi:hypothetical protein VTO42DRAFT_7252 [Malbranchea cinnamomea]